MYLVPHKVHLTFVRVWLSLKYIQALEFPLTEIHSSSLPPPPSSSTQMSIVEEAWAEGEEGGRRIDTKIVDNIFHYTFFGTKYTYLTWNTCA